MVENQAKRLEPVDYAQSWLKETGGVKQIKTGNYGGYPLFRPAFYLY
jgi:hypothetical protein